MFYFTMCLAGRTSFACVRAVYALKGVDNKQYALGIIIIIAVSRARGGGCHATTAAETLDSARVKI